LGQEGHKEVREDAGGTCRRSAKTIRTSLRKVRRSPLGSKKKKGESSVSERVEQKKNDRRAKEESSISYRGEEGPPPFN